MDKRIEKAYQYAKEQYAAVGVDTDRALERLFEIPISIHCWQGDDVCGFENPEGSLSGGIQATGNYPGKARNADELRNDLEMLFTLIPGPRRLSLHAIYLESNKPIKRDEIRPEHFIGWADWALEQSIGLDFNPTLFSHPMAEDGFTLSHKDASVRNFWIEHCKRTREIGAFFGKKLNTPCINNIWIPDGYKDVPIDRLGPRKRLEASLDEILSEAYDTGYLKDAVESKLFGIGSESYVTGSHEFYLLYAHKKGILLTLDTGHFHPTEAVYDKISSVLTFMDEMLLHVSRPVRWDSDHVVRLDQEVVELACQIVRNDATDRIHIGLDFFDASINRLAAWTIGVRNMQKALLIALLEPLKMLRDCEAALDYTKRLAWLEEMKSMPWQAVWDYACNQKQVPVGTAWIEHVNRYETDVLSKRS